MVGYGSNASPTRLRQKLATLPAGWALPVIAGRLRGADAVFSAHITAYGAVPATLHDGPDTEIDVAVSLLSPRQADLVRASEGGNYRLERLGPGRLALMGGLAVPDAAWVYRSRFGALAPDGSPVALRAVPARGRVLPEAGQEEMLARVAALVAPEGGVRELVLGCVADPALRGRRVARLAAWAIR